MLDATICDIYLVDDAGNIAGRPILTACVAAYSSLCCGYSLSWEGGVYSLRGLMLNIIADKKNWCEQFGISLLDGAWNCNQLPGVFVTDMGKEYTSETFEQITELGVRVVNLPPYRPELKGTVEKFFDLVQETYKKHLRGKGVIEPDFGDRGAHDYRLDACLTMRDFEKIVLYCILYYNCERILEKFPYTAEMLAAGIRPHASDIWNHGKSQMGANLICKDNLADLDELQNPQENLFDR
jgi:transposase InsO family protein